MTHQQPKEYIITESELEDLHAMSHGAYERQVIEIHQRVHARPHPAPLAKENLTVGMLYAYEAGERDGAREAAQQRIEQKFNSTELLLLAHDEWKRREERKHNHENAPWVSGFINGFCTDKKWAREYVDKLKSTQQQAGEP